MNISVVVTTFNEQTNIGKLLHSFLRQSRNPSEIVIVDGGSSDQTVNIIKRFAKKNEKLKIRVYQKGGNISQGRNFGVEHAKSNIIAMTDAGCQIDHNWIKEICKPFKNRRSIVVAGAYEFGSKTAFQKAVAPFFGYTIKDGKDKDYLPSARSIAFSKDAWMKAGKFNEHLSRAGEDTMFGYRLVLKKIEILPAPRAKVIWDVPTTISECCLKFYYYAKGDAETGIWWHPAKRFKTHNLKTLSIYLRYVLFLTVLILEFSFAENLFIFLFLTSAYLVWSVVKMLRKVPLKSLFYVPLIQILSDFSIMLGFLSGVLTKRV